MNFLLEFAVQKSIVNISYNSSLEIINAMKKDYYTHNSDSFIHSTKLVGVIIMNNVT